MTTVSNTMPLYEMASKSALNTPSVVAKTPLAKNEAIRAHKDDPTQAMPDDRGRISSASVEEAIVQFKEHVQNLRRELEFTFDEQTRQVIIKVHDSSTGDVIRQIPSEEFVAMARRLQGEQDTSLIDMQA